MDSALRIPFHAYIRSSVVLRLHEWRRVGCITTLSGRGMNIISGSDQKGLQLEHWKFSHVEDISRSRSRSNDKQADNNRCLVDLK